MAVDTREKRNSAFALLVPSLIPGVAPSSIDAAERQASVWMYSGITAAGGAAAPVGITGRLYLPWVSRIRTKEHLGGGTP